MRPYAAGSRPALDAFLDEAPDSHLLLWAGAPPDEPGRFDRVAVLVQDRIELRAFPVAGGIRSAAIAVWLDAAGSALSLSPRPEWPALTVIRSRAVDGGWLTVLRFASPVAVHSVVAELARQSVWPDRVGQRGVVVAEPGRNSRARVPPDVVIAGVARDWETTGDDSAVANLGREPYVVTRENRTLGVGPYDERVLNPSGFRPDADGEVVDLSDVALLGGGTEHLVRELRSVRGVRVDDAMADEPVARLAGALAMAGVPLVADELATGVAAKLGPNVAAAIAAPVDLGDPLAREAHSIVLRRSAYDELSMVAWRRRLGDLTGARVRHQPSVSVVLATRRPEMLAHAVRQVASQRGVEQLELVLAPHGFTPDAGELAELAGELSIRVVPATADTLFGDVLNAAADAAAGDVVLKMDDDDWYSPDLVADLLRARGYSGAELVGSPDDLYYLEPRDLTVRLGQPSEVYRQFVAGGTMMVERQMLREIGGFRSVRRHVDAQLIAAIREAGGATYRIHGLGYCLRRTESGHTWEADLDELVGRAAQTWPGLRLGPLIT